MTKRSKITLLGLLALIAAFGLILTGCPDPNNDSSSSGSSYTPTDYEASFTATAGTNQYLKLVVDGGSFGGDAQVYFKDDGTAILVTSEAPPTGYTINLGFSSFGKGKLASSAAVTVVAATPAAGTQLKAGKITVTVKTDAYTAKVTGARAGMAIPVDIPANGGAAYTVAVADPLTGASTIRYTAASGATPAKVSWKASSGEAVPAKDLDVDFDAAIIAVLSQITTAGDKVISGGSGSIISAEFSAGATAAKINRAFEGTDAIILAADTTLSGDVWVPGSLTVNTTKALTISGTVRLGPNAVIDASAVSSSIIVGGTADKVTLALATITAPLDGDTITATAGGALTVPASEIVLKVGTGIAILGNGKLTTGLTEFTGAGAWAVGAYPITIAAAPAGATISAGTAATFTASGTPVITQKAGAANALTIGGNVTVALGGTASKVGSIVLTGNASNGGKLALTAATGTITTGNTTSPTAIGGVSSVTIGGKTVTLSGFAVNDITGTSAATGNLSTIGGTATAGTMVAGTEDVTLAGDKAIQGS
jgi:hypothetical protein